VDEYLSVSVGDVVRNSTDLQALPIVSYVDERAKHPFSCIGKVVNYFLINLLISCLITQKTGTYFNEEKTIVLTLSAS
jgi:hypothetical protein